MHYSKTILRWNLWSILLLTPCCLSGQEPVAQTLHGTIYKVTQTDASYTFDSAVYHVFIPATAANIRGVFIHQHGCTMEGRGMSTAFDLQYQAFAGKWNLAIVGPDLYAAAGNCHDWKDPSSGSAAALMKTLQEVGERSGRRELHHVPWLLWGHSGGGYWAQAMMRDYPERTIALFSYSPGLDPDWEYPRAALKVPVMIRHAGPVGDGCCWQSALNTYHRLRNDGGLVGIAFTPYQNHNHSYVRYMAIPFFESVLRQRLPDAGGDPRVLRDMDEAQAWLGDTLQLNTCRSATCPVDRRTLCWLPDSVVAAKWKEFVITGTVIDRTPPPTPDQPILRIINNRNIALSWSARADIESGIKYFNIYQAGRLIARFPPSGDYQRFDTNGDDAIPVSTLPEMKVELTGIVLEEGKIAVSTVNHFLLESGRLEFPQ